LKILLDAAGKAGKDASCFKRGLVSGAALPPSLRKELGERGVAVKQCYAVAEAGVISYESDALDGMIVNEDIILEIVRPGTGDPVADGEGRGSSYYHVQSGLSDDPPRDRRHVRRDGRPLALRAAPHAHQGLDGPRRSDHQGEGAMFVRPEQVARWRSAIRTCCACASAGTREAEQDAMTLSAECANGGRGLSDAVAETLQVGEKLKGAVMISHRGRCERRQGDRGRASSGIITSPAIRPSTPGPAVPILRNIPPPRSPSAAHRLFRVTASHRGTWCSRSPPRARKSSTATAIRLALVERRAATLSYAMTRLPPSVRDRMPPRCRRQRGSARPRRGMRKAHFSIAALSTLAARLFPHTMAIVERQFGQDSRLARCARPPRRSCRADAPRVQHGAPRAWSRASRPGEQVFRSRLRACARS
jgi:hypothetical protein